MLNAGLTQFYLLPHTSRAREAVPLRFPCWVRAQHLFPMPTARFGSRLSFLCLLFIPPGLDFFQRSCFCFQFCTPAVCTVRIGLLAPCFAHWCPCHWGREDGDQESCRKSCMKHTAVLPSSQGFAFCGSWKFTMSYLYSKQLILWFYILKQKQVLGVCVHCRFILNGICKYHVLWYF